MFLKIVLKPVFLIAIVAVAMIGVMVPSVFAIQTIQGAYIPYGEPYGCISQDVFSSSKYSSFKISLKAYTPNPDVNVVILADEKTIKNQSLSIDKWTPVSTIFQLSNYNPGSGAAKKTTIEFQICLFNPSTDNGEKLLRIDSVRITPQAGTEEKSTSNFENQFEKKSDCTPIEVTSDAINKNGNLVFSDKPFNIIIENPYPNTCQYDVRIHNYEKNESRKIGNSDVVSEITTSISKRDFNSDIMFYKNTNYWLSIRSTDNTFYKFYPLIIDYSPFNPNNYQYNENSGNSSSENSKLNIDPTIILIAIAAVVGIAIIAVALSKRKKKEPKQKPKDAGPLPRGPEPTKRVSFHDEKLLNEFVEKCEEGTQEDMFTIMKRKYSDEEYRKTLHELLGDLNKINADNGIKITVFAELSTIPDPKKEDSSKGEGFGGMGGGKNKGEGQKKKSKTKPKQERKKVSKPKRTPVVEPKFDSEKDRILNATNPLDVLGLSPNVSLSVIKSKYRELSIKYDPNKGIINKSDVQKEQDHKISTKLNNAYSQLKRQNLD